MAKSRKPRPSRPATGIPLTRSQMMARVRRRDTTPELLLRSALHRLGLRFRIDRRIAGTRPDIVFGPARVAVFVDGCFWHGCPIHGTMPKTNRDFWVPKLEGNQERDRRQDALLAGAGWRVIRIWEHEITADGVERLAAVVGGICTKRRITHNTHRYPSQNEHHRRITP